MIDTRRRTRVTGPNRRTEAEPPQTIFCNKVAESLLPAVESQAKRRGRLTGFCNRCMAETGRVVEAACVGVNRDGIRFAANWCAECIGFRCVVCRTFVWNGPKIFFGYCRRCEIGRAVDAAFDTGVAALDRAGAAIDAAFARASTGPGPPLLKPITAGR